MFIKLSSFVLNIIIIINLVILKFTNGSSMDIYKNARLGTRIVQTKYGRLQGLVLPLDNFKFLKPVEAFLGVPYGKWISSLFLLSGTVDRRGRI